MNMYEQTVSSRPRVAYHFCNSDRESEVLMVIELIRRTVEDIDNNPMRQAKQGLA